MYPNCVDLPNFRSKWRDPAWIVPDARFASAVAVSRFRALYRQLPEAGFDGPACLVHPHLAPIQRPDLREDVIRLLAMQLADLDRDDAAAGIGKHREGQHG